jgi:hypothetical protein
MVLVKHKHKNIDRFIKNHIEEQDIPINDDKLNNLKEELEELNKRLKFNESDVVTKLIDLNSHVRPGQEIKYHEVKGIKKLSKNHEKQIEILQKECLKRKDEKTQNLHFLLKLALNTTKDLEKEVNDKTNKIKLEYGQYFIAKNLKEAAFLTFLYNEIENNVIKINPNIQKKYKHFFSQKGEDVQLTSPQNEKLVSFAFGTILNYLKDDYIKMQDRFQNTDDFKKFFKKHNVKELTSKFTDNFIYVINLYSLSLADVRPRNGMQNSQATLERTKVKMPYRQNNLPIDYDDLPNEIYISGIRKKIVSEFQNANLDINLFNENYILEELELVSDEEEINEEPLQVKM